MFEHAELGQGHGRHVGGQRSVEGAHHGRTLRRRHHRVQGCRAIAFGILRAHDAKAQQAPGRGGESDGLCALLQFERAAQQRRTPLAVVVADVDFIIAHLAMFPVLVVAQCQFDAIDQPALREADHPFMRPAFHGRAAHGAEPRLRLAIEGVFQRMAAFFRGTRHHLHGVGRQGAPRHGRGGELGIQSRHGQRASHLQGQGLADILRRHLHVQGALAVCRVEEPALACAVVGGTVGRCRDQAPTRLDGGRTLARQHAQRIAAPRFLARVLAIDGADIDLHVAARLFHADDLLAEGAALVLARVAIVFIQGVCGVAVRIDIQGQLILRLLAVVQHFRIHGQDGAGTHEHGQFIQRDLYIEVAPLRAGRGLAAIPVVVPRALRQVDALAPAATDGLAAVDGRHQHVAAQQELVFVGFRVGGRVLRIIPHQAAHQRRARLLRFAHQGIHIGSEAHLQLQIAAVDVAVRLLEPPRMLALGGGPAGHAHQDGCKAFPLQVAQIGFRAAAKDGVDVARRIRLAGQARADQRGNVPADVVPAGALVARPRHGVALDAGPAHHRPQERPAVGVVQDAVVGGLVRVHGKLVALARPRHVQLLHAAARLAHFPGDLVDAVFRPQTREKTVAGQAFHGFRQVRVAAAVAVIGQNPAARHVVFAVLARHRFHHVRRLARRAIAPALRHGAGLFHVVTIVVAIGIAVFQRPAGQHARAARQVRVAGDDVAQVLADKEIRIETPFRVLQRNLLLVAQVVVAVGPGIAQHAPAA
ncbi:hypothetical protein D3C81_783120 [compost metagenome]